MFFGWRLFGERALQLQAPVAPPKAIDQLAKNRSEAYHMGKAARKYVVQYFNRRDHAHSFVE